MCLFLRAATLSAGYITRMMSVTYLDTLLTIPSIQGFFWYSPSHAFALRCLGDVLLRVNGVSIGGRTLADTYELLHRLSAENATVHLAFRHRGPGTHGIVVRAAVV